MWRSLGFSVYCIMSCAYSDSFTSSLPVCIPFLSFFCLMRLGLPILCWVEVVRAGILVLFQILVGMLSGFHHWALYWLFVRNIFYYVEIFPLCTHFGKRVFLKKFNHFIFGFVRFSLLHRFFCSFSEWRLLTVVMAFQLQWLLLLGSVG